MINTYHIVIVGVEGDVALSPVVASKESAAVDAGERRNRGQWADVCS